MLASKQINLFLIMLLFSSNGSAFEVFVHDTGPAVGKKLKEVEVTYPRATAADVTCGKAHHMTRFRLNETYAGLPFSIVSKKMTRIKVRWDYPEKVLFPYSSARKIIVFPHAGGTSQLYFRAFNPVSGNVYIMDDQNKTIKTCPYSFLPAKTFRQSINVNVNDTRYDHDNLSSNNDSNSYSINYRISPINTVPS